MSMLRCLWAHRQAVMAHRWTRFCLVGGAASLSYALLGLLFVRILQLPLIVGNGLAYALSFAISYLGQSRWTFGMPRHRRGQGVRFMGFALAQLFGLGLNSLIIYGLVSLQLPYWLAMSMAIVPVAVVVYALCRYAIFYKGVAADNAGRGLRDMPGHPLEERNDGD